MCGITNTDDGKISLFAGWTSSSIFVDKIKSCKGDNDVEIIKELNKFTKKQLIKYIVEMGRNGDEG